VRRNQQDMPDDKLVEYQLFAENHKVREPYKFEGLVVDVESKQNHLKTKISKTTQ
jgi:hypothetical protein